MRGPATRPRGPAHCSVSTCPYLAVTSDHSLNRANVCNENYNHKPLPGQQSGMLGPGEGGNRVSIVCIVWWSVEIFSLVILVLKNQTIFNIY